MSCSGTRVLLNAVTSTGAGSSTLVKGLRDHSCHYSFTNTTGAVSAVSIDLEGSMDNSDWFVIDSHTFTAQEITDKEAIIKADLTVKYVRANLVTCTSSGTYTFTAKYIGSE